MDTKDWITVLGTIVGPVFAVQAQKAVEAFRQRNDRKANVFAQLMATRAARVSPEHVRALNMIDLVFYGRRVFGFMHRSNSEKAVLDAWKEYHDHLGIKAEGDGLRIWHIRGDDLFTELLVAIAQDVDYSFDRVQLKKGAYSPIAHGDLEVEQAALRRAALRALEGETPLKMNVVGFPVDEAATEAHRIAATRLSAALSDGTLLVKLEPKASSES